MIRIVKMEFHSNKTEAFQQLFFDSKHLIEGMKGCNGVKLLRDKENRNVFFTYSNWESTKHLNAYRNSKTFEEIWTKTKLMFSAKPEAWSVDEM